jgi:hypothetical protein
VNSDAAIADFDLKTFGYFANADINVLLLPFKEACYNYFDPGRKGILLTIRSRYHESGKGRCLKNALPTLQRIAVSPYARA